MNIILSKFIISILDSIFVFFSLKLKDKTHISQKKIQNSFLMLFTAIAITITDIMAGNNQWSILIDICLLVIYMSFLLRSKPLKYKGLTIIIFLMIFIASDSIIGLIIPLIFQMDLQQIYDSFSIRLIGLFLARSLCMIIFLKFPLNIRIKKNHPVMIIVIFDIIYISFAYNAIYYLHAFSSIALIITASGLLLLNIIINKILTEMQNMIIQKMKIEKEQELYINRIKKIESEYEYIAHFNHIKHDINNHIQMIKSLLTMEKIDEAKDYIDNVMQSISIIDTEINDASDNIIQQFTNYKFNYAKDKDINVINEICVQEEVKIDTMHICSIIGNILDNAIEANQQLPPTQRKIDFHIYTENQYLIIEC